MHHDVWQVEPTALTREQYLEREKAGRVHFVRPRHRRASDLGELE